MSIEQIDYILSFLIKNTIKLIMAFYIIGYISQFYFPTTKIKNRQRRLIYIFLYTVLIVLGCIILGFIFFFENVELKIVGIVLVLAIINSFILYYIDDSNSLVNNNVKKNVEVNQNERNNRDKRNDDESPFDILTKLEIRNLERECEEIRVEIEKLYYERNNIRTGNSMLDEISGSILNKSELRHNQKRRDELTRQIRDKENELSDKKRDIEFKKSLLGIH